MLVGRIISPQRQFAKAVTQILTDEEISGGLVFVLKAIVHPADYEYENDVK